MYKIPRMTETTLEVNESVIGETIETKIERIVNNKEPIKDGAPIIYTQRAEGIRASTNIRTDRFEIAVDAADKVAKSYKARREESAKVRAEMKVVKDEKDGGAESIQGKEGSTGK